MNLRASYFALAAACSVATLAGQSAWPIHDRDRPNPPVVSSPTTGAPPSDAVVLFDGRNLDAWESQRGGAVPWKVENNTFTITPRSGSIQTKQAFGDCQLHVEWATPNPPQGEDQMRGNSGVLIMGLYELQVLDSYNARTYADGQAGALYGQYPPLVNASRAPGEWQTYDVVFHAPRFDAEGRLVRRATETVIYNGVLVQDHSELTGPTANHDRPPYFPIADRLPLVLQDHGTPVRYRNIWIRNIPAPGDPLPVKSFVPLRPSPSVYAAYVGTYGTGDLTLSVPSASEKLTASLSTMVRGNRDTTELQLVPVSDDAFIAEGKAGSPLISVFFTRSGSAVNQVVLLRGGRYTALPKSAAH